MVRLLAQNDASATLIISGILHDTLEDTDVKIDDLKPEFGDKVASLVSSISEPDKKKSWKERKTQTIKYLRDQGA